MAVSCFGLRDLQKAKQGEVSGVMNNNTLIRELQATIQPRSEHLSSVCRVCVWLSLDICTARPDREEMTVISPEHVSWVSQWRQIDVDLVAAETQKLAQWTGLLRCSDWPSDWPYKQAAALEA